MALATKCPHCNTIFRVAHDQLKLRGGIVRCGACNEVFDGNAALVEPAAKPSPVMPSVPVAFAPVEPPHHLDPETVAGALAEEHSQDEAPATSQLLDAMPSADDGAAAELPLVEQDVFAESAPAMPDHEDTPPASSAPADEESFTATDTDVGPTADAEASAMADEQPGAPLDVDAATPTEADSLAPAEAESIAATDGQAVADDFSSAAEAAAAAPSPEVTPADNEAPPGEEPVHPVDEELAAARDPDDAAAPSAEEPAGSLDFIVDPDEFTDPLASPQAQDTAREHLVAAALDEAHHFDDLPVEGADVPASVDESQAMPAEGVPAASEEQETDTQQDEEANRNADEAAAADLIGAAPESASLAATGSAAAAATAAAAVDTEDDGSAEEPGFVKRANRRQRLHRISKAVMAFGSPILLAALVAQGVTTFRNPLAAAFPALKPTLNALCEPLGCKVNLPMQIDMLAIEQGELQTLADNTFSFATVLRNQARSAQSWPSIELTLNDASDKALVRRVFTPRDYLPSQADVDKGFAPRSEQSIKLYFELSQVKASGYHIAIFYP
ncbi:DUF3426 domain-containing protein [Massilia sp. SM-13]|uniref:DUF3426 domain-containing protein n=1 Tax=Pseudoduganella rhizocola TaxID=3382643 RepID=UPI0038B4495E